MSRSQSLTVQDNDISKRWRKLSLFFLFCVLFTVYHFFGKNFSRSAIFATLISQSSTQDSSTNSTNPDNQSVDEISAQIFAAIKKSNANFTTTHAFGDLCENLPDVRSHFFQKMYELGITESEKQSNIINQLVNNQRGSLNPLTAELWANIISPYVTCIRPKTHNESFFNETYDQERINNAKHMYDKNYIESTLNMKEKCSDQRYSSIFTGNINQQPLFMIDMFAFGYEMDILEIRVNELYDVIDHFLLVESTYGQKIIHKPVYYDIALHNGRLARMDPFQKVIHYIDDDILYYGEYKKYYKPNSDELVFDPNNFRSDVFKGGAHGNDWRGEGKWRTLGFQYYLQTLYNGNIDSLIEKHPRAVLIASDLDIILNKNKLRLLKYCELKRPWEQWTQQGAKDAMLRTRDIWWYSFTFSSQFEFRGGPILIYKIDKNVLNAMNGHSNAVSGRGFEDTFGALHINGWHLSRFQTPYQFMNKLLYLAEGASFHYISMLCNDYTSNRKAWSIRSYDGTIIDRNYYKRLNLSRNNAQCKQQVLFNPYYWTPLTDLGVTPLTDPSIANQVGKRNEKINERKNGRWKHLPLPEYVAANKRRFASYFPQFCKLIDINNPWFYHCNFTHWKQYHFQKWLY